MAQKQKLQNSGMQIPDDAILRIAQAMLPLMQQYFESEEGRLQLSGQTEALEQKEAAPASQPAPPLIYFLRQFVSLIVKYKSEPISIYEIVRICYVW